MQALKYVGLFACFLSLVAFSYGALRLGHPWFAAGSLLMACGGIRIGPSKEGKEP